MRRFHDENNKMGRAFQSNLRLRDGVLIDLVMQIEEV
jgi:hypothetical protein